MPRPSGGSLNVDYAGPVKAFEACILNLDKKLKNDVWKVHAFINRVTPVKTGLLRSNNRVKHKHLGLLYENKTPYAGWVYFKHPKVWEWAKKALETYLRNFGDF